MQIRLTLSYELCVNKIIDVKILYQQTKLIQEIVAHYEVVGAT